MREDKNISNSIKELQQAIAESGYFPPELFGGLPDYTSEVTPGVHQIQGALRDAKNAEHELEQISEFLHERVIAEILRLDRRIRDPDHFSELRGLLEGLLSATDDFRHERQLAKVYGELLSVYVLMLYRCGSPGREGPIIQMILSNVARRKAPELGQAQLQDSLNRLERIHYSRADRQAIRCVRAGCPTVQGAVSERDRLPNLRHFSRGIGSADHQSSVEERDQALGSDGCGLRRR